LVGKRGEFAINAQVRIIADLEVQVGGAPLHGDTKKIINIHLDKSPGLNSYHEPKARRTQDDLSNGVMGVWAGAVCAERMAKSRSAGATT
jgi:hypothetical protein